VSVHNGTREKRKGYGYWEGDWKAEDQSITLSLMSHDYCHMKCVMGALEPIVIGEVGLFGLICNNNK